MECSCKHHPDEESRPELTQRLKDFYLRTKDVFAQHSSRVESSEVPHPGTENVSFEEAVKLCPHMAQKYGNNNDNDGQTTAANGEARSSAGRCPYQNPDAQEWPMRAVLTFLAYNIISTGVSIEWLKIAFVGCAYHMGMIKISEFITLYLTTVSLSNYKLLGLLLMLTNKGGPVFSSDQYSVTISRVFIGVLLGFCTIIWTFLSMWGAVYFGYFAQGWQEIETRNFSPLTHILLPIGMEFVYRGFLLKECGKDLGAWFGIVASSGWFCILQRGPAMIKWIAFSQGVFWSLCTLSLKGDLFPATTAHVLISCFGILLPDTYYHLILPNS